MKLEQIAQILQDAGIGTIADDIFVHYMPAEVRKGVMLRNPLAGTAVDLNLPDYYRGELQAIVRHTNHAEGELLAKSVSKTMKMFNRKINDPSTGKLVMQINYIIPKQLPIVYPHTPSESLEWSLNFSTSYVEPE